MMKFSALNESSLSDDNGDPELATREAQEEEAYSIYHSALRKQYEGDLEESEEMFKDLLEMEFLTQAQPKEEKNNTPLGPALTLKYLVYKNLATISKEKEDFRASVSFYLEALEIDSSDVMMWYHMGKASLNIYNYSLARLCFEEGLKCNPNHWPCLDNVISVMYTLNDYANCLYYIALALEKECYYLKGLAIKDQIYKEDPSLKSFCECYFKKCDSSIHFCDYDKEEADKFVQECLEMREKKRSFYKPKPLPVLALGHPIKEYTWKNIGDSLVNVYDCIANADPRVSFSCKVDLSPYVENKISDQNSKKVAVPPSPVSSLSEAFSSNSAPQNYAGQQNGIVMQLVPDPTVNEMDVDDATTAGKTDGAPSTLLLPQADVQPTDLSIYTDSTSSTRRTKRKRSELAEFSDFASKRRSTRVRNPTIKRPQDNTNYQELLHKFLPPKLIGDGKFDDQDYDSDQLSQDKSSGDHTYGQSADKEKKDSPDQSNSSSFCSAEKEEVCDFIAKNLSNGGVIDLLYKYVVVLGCKNNISWPRVLIDVFCSAFSRLRKHITTPNIFSRSTEACRIKELAWGFLLYCEFKVDQWYKSTGHSVPFSLKMASSSSGFSSDKVGNDFHADMEFLVQLVSRYDVLGEELLNFSARALWLKAKFHSLEGEIDLAVSCMRKLNDVLSGDDSRHVKIIVQNCNNSNLISAGVVKQQLESLQRCQSLEEVQRLYEHGDYAAVVDLLVLTFNQPRTSRKQSLDGVPERHAQLLLLQNSLMKLERYKECVYWSEVSFNEALQQFMNATKNSEWSETMAQLLSGLDKCAKLDSSYLSDLEESKLVRLTQNLVLVIVIQMENYDFAGDNAALLVVLPWIILYRLILNEEKRERAKSSSSTNAVEVAASSKGASSSFLADFDLSASMPSSLMLLFTAHECLGRRSWCTASDGSLLLTFINILMSELQDITGSSLLYREDLETGLEQCIYCLYGHPNKRSRAKHLQEHNTKQITLTWERAVLIFQYFKPNILPEFDSYRTSTISAELENLFRRISALVPPDEDPTSLVDGYTAYIEGGTDKCPDPPFGNKILSNVVKDLYYLLGDYYFKNKEFSKAIRFYLCDICINPDRQDSWAGMALSRSSLLDQKLNSYDLRNESTIYRKASAALRCFEHALELDPTTTSLWIEYGSLAYILHSHASRQLKQETFCDEMHDMLKKKKLEMLEVAKRCFRAANHCEDGGEPEEAWLHHYMLGKICEKEGEGPVIYLDHYRKALAYLHEDFARYPQKILYHNPAELSIEALEVYYRVHASCLKFLWKNESSGLDLTTVKIVQDCLHSVKTSPFCTFQEKSKSEIVGSSSNAASEAEDGNTSKTIESQSKVDHNYSENTNKSAKKISEETRHGRPSTDSLPESQDLIVAKEILNSLVSVVAERFEDEAKEQTRQVVSNVKTEVEDIEFKQDSSKIIIESLAEESVYTSRPPADNTNKTPETEQISQIISSVLEPMFTDDMDEFAKLQELAKELETKAAACENQKVDSVKENDSVQEHVKEELSLPPVETSKDDEVLKSLSSILSSLEAVKNADANAAEQKSSDIEATIKDIDNQVKSSGDVNEVTVKVESEVSSLVTDNSIKNVEDKVEDSKCIQSIEISPTDVKVEDSNCIQSIEISPTDAKVETTDNSGVNKLPESMEVDIEEKHQAEENETTEKMDTSDVPGDKLTSNQNNDKSKTSDNKVDSQNEKKTETVDDSNQPPSTLPTPPLPSPEELKKSRSEILRLIPKCLDAMRECLQRFPQHYKALYRMAHYYCHSTSANRNLQWAREILLAATPATKKYPSMSGLFAERKNTNFFNGIWRAPSNEIDRPGSFGAHMYRSVHLLIDVLSHQKDYNMLVNLTLQLHRTPDLGKKYMRDTDRQFLVRKAYDSCVNILRDQLNTLLQEEPPPEESRLICCLLEIYRTWMTLVKASINVDDSNELLEEAYTMYKLGEVDSHPSVLEQAKNFCQIQLGKTYPQVDASKSGVSSKYASLSDVNASHANSCVPSASTYNPDAWQKELAESLMMPVLPCEGRTKSETKPVNNEAKPNPEPQVANPSDTSFNSSPSCSTATVSQNSATSPQMVHVEKPKAENLQACSVAFLPVTPVFPKENVKPSSVFQAPPLLSCQAFECFDVLTSIMQASGYQVAPQLGMPQTFDPTNARAHRKMQNMQQVYSNFPAKSGNTKSGRKRRRGKSPKLEGLNLSKKMHTKPIVSATIANSITQLKIDPIVSCDKKPQTEAVQSSPLCLVKPKSNKKIPCYKTSTPVPAKGLDLSKKIPETVTSAQCSVIVSTSESKKFNLAFDYNKEKPKEKPKEKIKGTKREKKIITDMLPDIYDFTDDSNLSANLETSRIEKCAKEMLKFMNQKIEDTAAVNEQVTDISISKTEMDSIFKLLEVENEPEKELNSVLQADDPKVGDTEKVLEEEEEPNLCSEGSQHREKVEEGNGELAMNESLIENMNQLSKDSNTEFTLFSPKLDDAEAETENNKPAVSYVLDAECHDLKYEELENLENLDNFDKQMEEVEEETGEKESQSDEKGSKDGDENFSNMDDSMPNIQDTDCGRCAENTDSTEENDKDNEDEVDTRKYEVGTGNESMLVKDKDRDKASRVAFNASENEHFPELKYEGKDKSEESDEDCNDVEGADEKLEFDRCERLENSPNTEEKENTTKEQCVELTENINDSEEEITMPVLEAESLDPKSGCSKTEAEQCNVIQFGEKERERSNETKNINYSVLKKDCVVVIRLKDEYRRFHGDWSKSEGKRSSTDKKENEYEEDEQQTTEDED